MPLLTDPNFWILCFVSGSIFFLVFGFFWSLTPNKFELKDLKRNHRILSDKYHTLILADDELRKTHTRIISKMDEVVVDKNKLQQKLDELESADRKYLLDLYYTIKKTKKGKFWIVIHDGKGNNLFDTIRGHVTKEDAEKALYDLQNARFIEEKE